MTIFKKLTLALFASLLVLMVPSCKKNEGEVSKTTKPDYGQGYGPCRLVETKDTILNQGEVRAMTPQKYIYDDKYRITYISLDNSVGNTFTYDGNVVRRSGVSTGSEVDSMVLDQNGNIIKKRFERSAATGMDYYYNAKGELYLEIYQTNYPMQIRDTTFYFYENGDMIKKISKAGTVTYSYDLNEPFQFIGDGRAFSELFYYGRPLIKTKHLAKTSISQFGDTFFYEYQFDKDHRIISLKMYNTPPPYSQYSFGRYFYYSCEE